MMKFRNPEAYKLT